jgi:5-methylcytosine-specific restriction endonuclease McrA
MIKGTYRHSEATKQRMRDAHKGQVISHVQRKKISVSRLDRKARLGFLNSPETRRKLSDGRTGRKNWNYGRPRSEETRRKIADAQRGRTGRRHTLETRRQMGLSRTGPRNPAWKGGICTPERIRFLQRRRKVQKRANGGSHTYGEWQALKAQYNWTCPGCGRHEPEIKLTEDHIIPISKGGSDNIENIQPLCQSCNSMKYTQTIRYLPKAV